LQAELYIFFTAHMYMKKCTAWLHRQSEKTGAKVKSIVKREMNQSLREVETRRLTLKQM